MFSNHLGISSWQAEANVFTIVRFSPRLMKLVQQVLMLTDLICQIAGLLIKSGFIILLRNGVPANCEAEYGDDCSREATEVKESSFFGFDGFLQLPAEPVPSSRDVWRIVFPVQKREQEDYEPQQRKNCNNYVYHYLPSAFTEGKDNLQTSDRELVQVDLHKLFMYLRKTGLVKA